MKAKINEFRSRSKKQSSVYTIGKNGKCLQKHIIANYDKQHLPQMMSNVSLIKDTGIPMQMQIPTSCKICDGTTAGSDSHWSSIARDSHWAYS